MKLTEILHNVILTEGRVEDAQQYFEKAVGSWPVAEEVIQLDWCWY